MNAAPGAGELPAYVGRILDEIPYPLLLVRLDGAVVHTNGAWVELTRIPAADTRGRRLHDLVRDTPEHVDELLRRWATSAQPRPGVLPVGTDHTSHPATLVIHGCRVAHADLLLLRCRERDTAVRGFEALSREVEARNLRQVKQRLESTIEELRQANRRLADANAELERYAMVVSHDLRAPLATITGFTDLLASEYGERLDEQGLGFLGSIRRNAGRMQDVIDALLQLAGTPGPPARVDAVDPVEVLSDVIEQVGIRSDDVDIATLELPRVAVDRRHLAQVFQNLFTNSLRYRAQERGLVIVVSGRRRDRMVEISVSDNGIGIPAADRSVVFEPLRRGRNVADREGSGIGLATCRKIVRYYGGDIAVSEPDGVGTTITFTVPAA